MRAGAVTTETPPGPFTTTLHTVADADCKRAAKTNLLHVADNGTLGHVTDGLGVTDVQSGLLAAVDELFRANEASRKECQVSWPQERRVASRLLFNRWHTTTAQRQ